MGLGLHWRGPPLIPLRVRCRTRSSIVARAGSSRRWEIHRLALRFGVVIPVQRVAAGLPWVHDLIADQAGLQHAGGAQQQVPRAHLPGGQGPAPCLRRRRWLRWGSRRAHGPGRGLEPVFCAGLVAHPARRMRVLRIVRRRALWPWGLSRCRLRRGRPRRAGQRGPRRRRRRPTGRCLRRQGPRGPWRTSAAPTRPVGPASLRPAGTGCAHGASIRRAHARCSTRVMSIAGTRSGRGGPR